MQSVGMAHIGARAAGKLLESNRAVLAYEGQAGKRRRLMVASGPFESPEGCFSSAWLCNLAGTPDIHAMNATAGRCTFDNREVDPAARNGRPPPQALQDSTERDLGNSRDVNAPERLVHPWADNKNRGPWRLCSARSRTQSSTDEARRGPKCALRDRT